MPGRAGLRKLGLAITSVSALVLAVFIPGCGSTVGPSTSPVTDIAFNPDRNESYIGAMTKVITPKGGGGFAIYELKKDHFIRKNETNGFMDPNVLSVQYDSVSSMVFILHYYKYYDGRLSLYDPLTGIISDTSISAKMMALAESKLFFSSGDKIYMSNRTGSNISYEKTELYPAGSTLNTTTISAMLWANDSLFFSMWNPPLLKLWKDGILSNITGQKCNCLAPGPYSTIFFGTDAGLGYYTPATGQVFSTSCSGKVFDLVTNYRDNVIYTAVEDSLGYSIKAYRIDGDNTTVLTDSSKCSVLRHGPTCVEFAVTRNELYAGTNKGMMIYNIVSKKIHTKTNKDGMPLEPTHYEPPGFEAVAAIAVVVVIVMMKKYRNVNR
jgi:hypothetical protein